MLITSLSPIGQYGADNIPRGWSKYTEGTSAHSRFTGTKKANPEFQVEETEAFRQQKEKLVKHINQLKADEQDPKLREYLDVMTSRSKGQTWTNDDLATLTSYSNSKMATNDQKQEQDIIAHNADDDLYDDLPSATKKDQPSASSTSDNDDTMIEEDKEDTVMDGGDDDKKIDDNNGGNDDDIPERAKAIQLEETKSNNETIGLIEDTGRLFVRNLSYSCSEQDLRDTFTKYGPISEVCLISLSFNKLYLYSLTLEIHFHP